MFSISYSQCFVFVTEVLFLGEDNSGEEGEQSNEQYSAHTPDNDAQGFHVLLPYNYTLCRRRARIRAPVSTHCKQTQDDIHTQCKSLHKLKKYIDMDDDLIHWIRHEFTYNIKFYETGVRKCYYCVTFYVKYGLLSGKCVIKLYTYYVPKRV